MKRATRSVYLAREYLDWCLEDFLAGGDLDLEGEVGRLKGVMGVLVDVAVVEVSDWSLPGLTFEQKCAVLPKLRSAV